jgi:glycosyltransferase involved in cell wall biosynthesis
MITVHMTTFRRNRSGLLRRATEAVLNQDYDDLEFVVCDDASSDGTQEYLQSLARKDSRVKVIRNARNVNSVAISLGRCLEAADPKRPYVTWMFDDCTLESDAFTVLLKQIAKRNDDFVFGATRVHNADGSVLVVGDRSVLDIRSNVANSSILVPNGGILITRSVFEKFGWYDPNIILRRSCDWDWFRRIIKGGCSFSCVDRILMDEYGGLQTDSLRNSFTTTFDLMAKYAHLRDKSRMDLSLRSCLSAQVDFIPPGDWSEPDLALIYYMFVEYFLSVGNVARAFVWAEKLKPKLLRAPFYYDNLASCVSSGDASQSLMAAGALAAGIYGSYREQLHGSAGAVV